MRFGLRQILLLIALVLFLLASVMDENTIDLLSWGLAALAGGLLVGDLGIDFQGRGTTRRGTL